MSARPLIAFASLLLSASFAAADQPSTTPIHALLITGHNNHNWPFTSRVHEDTLEATGRFVVDITDDPQTTLKDAAALKPYQLFILDYNDYGQPKPWGDEAQKNFTEAVRAGAGVISIHSADNAFKGWTEYEQMLGLMWRDGSGHGKFHSFDIETVDAEHPITKGLPAITNHPDELYHKLVNVQNTRPHLLMRAMDSKDIGGTGEFEPMAFTLEFGKGRVFATPLGHVWVGDNTGKASILDPQFRSLICRGAEWAATGSVTLPAKWADVRTHNTLTPAEAADGWTLLFDGSESSIHDNFRGFKKDAFPTKGWVVRDGALVHMPQGGGGDIVTDSQYADFEFACDWKVTKGANSGIIYRCDETHGAPWETGPEMQILDDANHNDGKKPATRAGTFYDVIPCSADVARPAGEWNSARILCRGRHIEHWLNGIKVVDINLDSDDFKAALAKSKWPGMKDFATLPSGHIALQDHGDEVAFRNIKVKVLK
jgi:type 1 glutamine amidotransferase